MRGRPSDEIKRLAMRRRHAERGHKCSFCGDVFFGNGGYSSHMRKEYFERMPDLRGVKWIEVSDLRKEWKRRQELETVQS